MFIVLCNLQVTDLCRHGGSMGHKLEIDTNNNINININTNKSVTNGQCVTIGVVDAGH